MLIRLTVDAGTLSVLKIFAVLWSSVRTLKTRDPRSPAIHQTEALIYLCPGLVPEIFLKFGPLILNKSTYIEADS